MLSLVKNEVTSIEKAGREPRRFRVTTNAEPGTLFLGKDRLADTGVLVGKYAPVTIYLLPGSPLNVLTTADNIVVDVREVALTDIEVTI